MKETRQQLLERIWHEPDKENRSMITEVKSYRTSDGSVHATMAEAEAFEARGDLREYLRKEGVGSGGEWSQDMIAKFMVEHAKHLYTLLGSIAAGQAAIERKKR